MGSFVDHRITRIECKRKIDNISKYKLSYDFVISERKIENKIFKIDYVFTIFYRNDVGEIVVEGSLDYKDSPKALKDLNSKWDENRDFQKKVYNLILKNSLTMVMDISRHLGLPPPIFIPEIEPAN